MGQGFLLQLFHCGLTCAACRLIGRRDDPFDGAAAVQGGQGHQHDGGGAIREKGDDAFDDLRRASGVDFRMDQRHMRVGPQIGLLSIARGLGRRGERTQRKSSYRRKKKRTNFFKTTRSQNFQCDFFVAKCDFFPRRSWRGEAAEGSNREIPLFQQAQDLFSDGPRGPYECNFICHIFFRK